MYPGIVEHRKIGHLDTGIKIFFKIVILSLFHILHYGSVLEHMLNMS